MFAVRFAVTTPLVFFWQTCLSQFSAIHFFINSAGVSLPWSLAILGQWDFLASPYLVTLSLTCLCFEVKSESRSVVSNSLWPHVLYSPRNSLGQNTGLGKPFPSPGDLPNPGMEPRSPALQVDSLPFEPQGKPPKKSVLGGIKLWWKTWVLKSRQAGFPDSAYPGSFPAISEPHFLTCKKGGL